MSKYFKKFALLLTKIFMGTFFSVHLHNSENVPEKGPVLLYSNHKSELDMFAIGSKINRWIYWMTKEELFKIPVLGWVLNLLGAFPVKRGKGDVNSIKRAYVLLEEGHAVGIFPGGTRNRSRDERSAKIRPGAIIVGSKAGVPMLPVAIKTDYKLFGKVNIYVGKPFYLDMDNNKKYSREELMEITRDTMEKVYKLLEEN